MLLTVSTTHRPATDLGHLVGKHPDRVQSFPVSAGTAHVFYPTAGPEEATVALLLEVDPVALARRRSGAAKDPAGTSGQFVNDRPYAAGSMLAVALGSVFSSARHGRSRERPELAATPIPLTVRVPTLVGRDGVEGGGSDLVERLFAPLGWTVHAEHVPLDPHVPDWGDSRYVDTTLRGELRLADALTHLYVLLPVLDGSKHYWVDEAEVDKLLGAGEAWLATHPERELISRRYLAHRRAYVRSALEQLAEADEKEPADLDNALDEPAVTHAGSHGEPLAVQRRGAVVAALHAVGARRVLDLGCGGGALLRDLAADPSFTEIVGVDVSTRALEVASRRTEKGRGRDGRVTLRQSALTYVDASLTGYDAAVLMEVIEHVDPERLAALEHTVFGAAAPTAVVVTTPNVEYNVRFPTLPAGRMRHPDHRFEWTRAEFRAWAERVADRYGYTVRHLSVGPEDPEVGSPTQLATFSRGGT